MLAQKYAVNNTGSLTTVKGANAASMLLARTLDTHGEAAQSVALFFDGEKAAECIMEMRAIEKIERVHTIESLQARGEASEVCTKLVRALDNYNINCSLMTPREAKRVWDYARNATPEIKEEKAEHIRELLHKVINGVHERRDYEFDAEKSMILQNLLDKHTRYESGELDMSRGFDVSLYPKKDSEHLDLFSANPSSYSSRRYEQEYDEYSSYSDEDDYEREMDTDDSESMFLNLLESLTDDELLDGGYVDEEDFFVYGPYTVNDIRNMAVLTYETWASTFDKRKTSRLESLLSEILEGRGENVETDLLRHFIGKLVLSARRPNAKNLVRMLSSFSQVCAAELGQTNTVTEREEHYRQLIKQKLYWCSYYVSRVCGYTKDELVKKFGQARPITSEFFTAVGEAADSWADSYVSRLDNDFDSYLLKADDHLFEMEAHYKALMREKNRASNESSGVSKGQLLLGGLV